MVRSLWSARTSRSLGAMALLAATAAACGDGAPAAPSASGNVAAISISASGVSPAAVQVAIGARVRFTNNDSVPHSIVSDPHPDNNDCPEVNQVGLLTPGQSRETGNFVEPRQCGFHDFSSPMVMSWRGTITIR